VGIIIEKDKYPDARAAFRVHPCPFRSEIKHSMKLSIIRDLLVLSIHDANQSMLWAFLPTKIAHAYIFLNLSHNNCLYLSTMESVKNYWDYRDFLKDFYTEKKKENNWFSLRYMGSKVSIDPSHLVKIFQHQRHIGNSSIDVFIKHCELSGSGAEYFAHLVRFNKAKSDRDSKTFYEKLLSLKGAGAKTLEKSKYEFYTQWYYSAILTLLDFFPFSGDYAALAAKVSPPISEAKAKKSIELLLKLGLIKKTQEGKFCLTNKIVTTGDHGHSIAVRTFQEETMRLAIEALERHPPEKRNISTVTITISETNLDRVNELISQFQESLLQLAKDEHHPDKVFQLNLQLFPLSQ
jgi:uncharacterized protein (TIGR02147 family)